MLVPRDFHKEKVFGVEDDMMYALWTTAVERPSCYVPTHAVGAITGGDALGGEQTLTTTAADNEELYFVTANELFRYDVHRPLWGIHKDVELVTLPAEINFLLGFQEAMETTPIQDAGVGPKADGDGFGFFKPETGGTLNGAFWYAWSQFGANQLLTQLSAANLNNLSGVDWCGHVGGATSGVYDFAYYFRPANRVTATTFRGVCEFWAARVPGPLQLVATHEMSGTYAITDATAELMNHGHAVRNITDICVATVGFCKGEQLRDPRPAA